MHASVVCLIGFRILPKNNVFKFQLGDKHRKKNLNFQNFSNDSHGCLINGMILYLAINICIGTRYVSGTLHHNVNNNGAIPAVSVTTYLMFLCIIVNFLHLPV